MRFTLFFFALVLFVCVAKAQWDEDPDDDPDDEPWRPTPTRRPTPTPKPTPQPTPTQGPPEPPTPTTSDIEDPPPPVFTGVDTFANATVYQPDDSSHHLTSPRTENLPNNTVLAVWNDPAQTKDTLSVYRSNNNGFSWYAHGTAMSKVSGRKLLEPHLLFVEGSFSGDTNMTLLAVNAVDAKSTNIELYASSDKGVTFDFVQRVAEGGAVGAKAVGEPHLLFHDKRLTVYYSDQRDSQHAQKISQQSTADIWDTWGSAIDVAVSNTVSDLEGMASVAKLPNNQYIVAYEASQGTSDSNGAVNFKLSSAPENAGTESVRTITATSGAKPQGAPSVAWSSVGGTNGTIILSDSTTGSLFINRALGQGPWSVIATPAGRAYAREVRAAADKRAIRITGGSEGKGMSADVTVTYMDFEKALSLAR
ncbi:hypothetical protein GQ44DRAFT_828627 [Phaeosphaeriaceae sp. PMI808]|nr:hypothetical protein GQ44DRAFT_828627 [Phaeosphaeriaceae sp. PMI808]